MVVSLQSTVSLAPSWQDIALRLACTVSASLAVGFNRGEHGKRAGMVTTFLVCLAASVAMIQVSLLLPLAGRASNSFIMNDLMRLPLGILTGVGFMLNRAAGRSRLRLDVRLLCRNGETQTPLVIEELARLPGVLRVQWGKWGEK
jgi:hypothetical protein